jgi:hypothetical protein
MQRLRVHRLAGSLLVLGVFLAAGCYNTPIDWSEYWQGPAPRRMPSPAREAEACDCYKHELTGGQIFDMYCNQCHNAPSLAERPFSNFQNVAVHMRLRANLTGEEYAKLVEFLRRWHDVPPPPPVEPSPKRFYFSQPIPELRPQTPAPGGATPAAPPPAKQTQLPAPDQGPAAGGS